jgi:hypothetical protein
MDSLKVRCVGALFSFEFLLLPLQSPSYDSADDRRNNC